MARIEVHPDIDTEMNQVTAEETRTGAIVDGKYYRSQSRAAAAVENLRSSQLRLPEAPRVYDRGGDQISTKTGVVIQKGVAGLKGKTETEMEKFRRIIKKLAAEGKLKEK